MFDNAFKNDKQFMTHAGDVFRTNADNVYRGTRATYDTILEPDRYDMQKKAYGRDGLRAQDEGWQYENAMKPENMDARKLVYDNNFQSRAAALEAGVASAGQPDAMQAAQAGQRAAFARPGALEVQGAYGRMATKAGNINLANDIATGNFDRANESLKDFGMQVMPAPGAPGKVVVRDAQGRTSMPLDPSAVEAQFRDRAGIKQGQGGRYIEKSVTDARDFEQQRVLNDARLAQRDRDSAARANREMGRRLSERLRNAKTPEERQDAQDDLDTYLSANSGSAYGSGMQAPSSADMRSRMMGAPAGAPAPAVAGTPAGTPAPAGAPAAKSVYSPNQGVTQGSAPASAHAPVTLWRPGQAVDDASMDQIQQAYVTANSKLKQVRSDWERANSLQNRAAVSPEVRERIKAALDAARAEVDQVNSQYVGAKREWMRVRGEQAYSPSRSLQQTASESINRDFGARYSN
jgi:hypothetical protein